MKNQNKKMFTGSADSKVMVAGNSRGDAAADVFQFALSRRARGLPTQTFFFFMCNVGFIMGMHNKIMTRVYIN